jgi:hypothetical protein
LRRRDRVALVGLAAAAGGVLVGGLLLFGVDQIITPISTPNPVAGAGPAASAEGVISHALDSPTTFLSYFWQTFLPPLPFMTDLWAEPGWPFYEIYIRTGFASFGWYAMEFAGWAYRVVTLVVAAVGVCALLSLWQHRHVLARRWPELALVVLAIAGVFGGVAAAYVQGTPRSGQPPEQGRYAFVAMAAFAAVAAAALLGLPRRWRPWAAGTLVTGMVGLLWASQFLLLQRFYT